MNTMNTTSDTPRTDASKQWGISRDGSFEVVNADFARTLERENHELKQGLVNIAAALGNGSCLSLEASVDFMTNGLANEVRLYCSALRDKSAELERELAEARKENAILRGLLPKLKVPCPYCGETDMAKCKKGFPGCDYADDLMLGQDEATKELLEKYRVTKKDSKRLDKLEQYMERIHPVVECSGGLFFIGQLYWGKTLRVAIDAIKP